MLCAPAQSFLMHRLWLKRNSLSFSTPLNISMLTFPNSSEELLSRTNALVHSCKSEIARIIQVARSSPTFADVLKPIALLEAKLWEESTSLTFPQYVSEDKAIRTAAAEASNIIQVPVHFTIGIQN